MTGGGGHLAQINIGRLVAPVDHPRVAAFMAALDRVNAIADRSPGFVWRLKGEGNNATDLPLSDDDPRFISNMSVWTDIAALEAFVWKSVHRAFYARRAAWFEVLGRPHFVMWPVPEGHIPTIAEGLARLADHEANGDSERGFGWAGAPGARLWRSRACAAPAA
ncbi:DUF3291 domain-containing protein [soil metagenome]